MQIPVGATKEQIDTVRYALRKFQGADAEEDVLVLSAGATMANATISPQQSQLVELHQLSTTQVAQITGVNPYFLFSDPNGKYNNNTQQAGEDIVRYCFRLLIEQAEDELLKLLSPAEQDAGLSIHIDPAALLRGDAIAESNIVTQQTAGGVISATKAGPGWAMSPATTPSPINSRSAATPMRAVRASRSNSRRAPTRRRRRRSDLAQSRGDAEKSEI